MEEININYDQIGDIGVEIKRIQSEIKEDLDAIAKEISLTENIWKSEAEQELKQKFNGMFQKTENFYLDLSEYARFLIRVAEEYGYVEKEIQKNSDCFTS